MSVVLCKQCCKGFKVFPSKIWRSHFCSNNCKSQNKIDLLKERERICVECNSVFTPRLFQIKTGIGKYCSAKCRNKAFLPKLLGLEAKRKSKTTYMENLASGKIKHLSGENHPRWIGGQKVSVECRIASGKANNSVKKYRRKNPDKVREWSTTRRAKKTGRLPKGTVKSLLEFQGYKCVYCKCDISAKYHMDHIIPLAKDGKHKPSNIQILCPSCNVRKGAKLNFP